MTFEDVPGLPQGRMFRLISRNAPTKVFLLAARDLDDNPDRESRSLTSIIEATVEGLGAVAREGFGRVSMGLLAAGKGRKEIAPYSLIAQLAGIRRFADSKDNASTLASVDIDILDPQVWSASTLGRIPVLDLLSSKLARVLVRVADRTGTVEEFALSMPEGSKVKDALAAYRINEEGLQVSPRPLSLPNASEVRDMPVFPGMVIEARSLR